MMMMMIMVIMIMIMIMMIMMVIVHRFKRYIALPKAATLCHSGVTDEFNQP